MSFGWSAGDIVLGISTLVKVGKAIKETGGAASEYQEALSSLTSIEATLRGLETIVASNPDLTLNDELVEQARLLKSAVDDFRKKVDKYDLSLGSDSDRRKIRRIPREVQFALSEKIKELQTAIIQPQLVLDVCINLQTLSSILELSQSNALSQDSVRTLITKMSYVMRTITDSLATMKQSVEMQSMQSTATNQDLRRGQENIAQSMQEFSASTNDRLEILLHKDSEPQVPGVIPLQIATSAIHIVATGIASAMGTLAALHFYAPKSHRQYEAPSSDLVRCAPNSLVPARSPSDDTTCKEAPARAARCSSYNLEEVSNDRQYRAGAFQKTNQVANPGSHMESDRYIHDPQVVPSSVGHFRPDRPINAPEPLATTQMRTFVLQVQDLGGVDDEPHKTKHHSKKLSSKQSSAISSSTKASTTKASSTTASSITSLSTRSSSAISSSTKVSFPRCPFTKLPLTKFSSSKESSADKKQVEVWEYEWVCCQCLPPASSLCMTIEMCCCPDCMHIRCNGCILALGRKRSTGRMENEEVEEAEKMSVQAMKVSKEMVGLTYKLKGRWDAAASDGHSQEGTLRGPSRHTD